MSKRSKKSDTGQLSLLDLIQRSREIQQAPTAQGSLNIEARLRRSLFEGIKHCQLDVYQIAGEMSHLLGETITAEMIYSWTAESKTRHQIWLSRIGAFVKVTGWRQPLEIAIESAGMFCLPGPEALRSEIQKLREEERQAAAERRKREMFLKEMEGGK